VIARLWHGITWSAAADDYLTFLRERAASDYRAIPGNLAVHLLHRKEGRLAHFIVLTHWESRQAIEQFAGADIEKAKYYPEDAGFLLEYEPMVRHYEISIAP
jgi:heme-degrading monooxygenase HmoA